MTRTVNLQDVTRKRDPVRPMCGNDKDCQSTQYMQPKKPASNMQVSNQVKYYAVNPNQQ